MNGEVGGRKGETLKDETGKAEKKEARKWNGVHRTRGVPDRREVEREARSRR
jgi:hypothetical protein